jgi:hypothetical protein
MTSWTQQRSRSLFTTYAMTPDQQSLSLDTFRPVDGEPKTFTPAHKAKISGAEQFTGKHIL